MDDLIQAMSVKELETLKETYNDNASIVAILDGYIASKVKEQEQAQIKAKFETGIAKLFAKLPHPEGVHNIYVRWAEVAVEMGEPEAVEVVDSEGHKATEMRTPKVMVFQWVVQVNHTTRLGIGTGAIPGTSKRAITVLKHNPDGADEDCGNFASASKACEALGLTIGSDSATRVLTRDGYYTKPYEGTDYTA